MVINTVRFGPIELIDDQIIHIAGLASDFAPSGRFILLEMQSADAAIWLQSVDNDTFALRLVDPAACVPGFKLPTNRQILELMRTSRNGELHAYLALERSGEYLVVNIDEPIVINKHSRRGLQLRPVPAEPMPAPVAAHAPATAVSHWRNRWSEGLDATLASRGVQAVA